MKAMTTHSGRTGAWWIVLGCAGLVLLLVAAAPEAQCPKTVSIPDNVYSNAGNCIPFSQCIGGGEARFQWFIDRKFIACSGFIKNMDIRPTSNFTFTAQNFEVTISHTTQTAHVSTFATNLPNPVIVHAAGTKNFVGTNATWSSLGLQKGFWYDGKSNLTIEARMQSLRASPSTTVFSDSTSVAGCRRTYALGSGAYSAATTTSSRTNAGGALKIRLHFEDAVLTGSGVTRPGGVVTLSLTASNSAGLSYQIGTSLGTGPIKIDTRQLGLSPDDLLVLSVSGLLPGVFSGYRGVLDNAGQAKGAINLPNILALVGIRLHSAFVTLSPSAPSGIKAISNTFSFSITK